MQYKEFYTTVEKLPKYLKKHGVAVIKGVLDDEEIKSMKKGMWETFEHLTKKFEVPIKEKKKDTWRSFYELYPLHSMLIQHHSIAHSQFVWDVRQNQKVAKVFSKLWSEIDGKEYKKKDMLSSFDGISIHLPPEETNRGFFRGNTWYHTDQSYLRNDLECYQGMVMGFDVNEGDATLACIEGSNNYHKKFAKKFKKEDKGDWCKLNEEETKWYIKKCQKKFDKPQVCVLAKAGDLILWDSRTIHFGKECDKDRKKSNFRLCVYTCQLPRLHMEEKTKEKMLLKKQKAFEELRVTSHWPHKSKLFAKTPRTYGKKMQEVEKIKKPKLTKLGKKLAGF